MKFFSLAPRAIALALCLALCPPSPAFALRTQSSESELVLSGLEEALLGDQRSIAGKKIQDPSLKPSTIDTAGLEGKPVEEFKKHVAEGIQQVLTKWGGWTFSIDFDGVIDYNPPRPQWALAKGAGNDWWIHLHLQSGLDPLGKQTHGLLFRFVLSEEGRIVDLADPMAESFSETTVKSSEESSFGIFVPLSGLVPEEQLGWLVKAAGKAIANQQGPLGKAIRKSKYKMMLGKAVTPGREGLYRILKPDDAWLSLSNEPYRGYGLAYYQRLDLSVVTALSTEGIKEYLQSHPEVTTLHVLSLNPQVSTKKFTVRDASGTARFEEAIAALEAGKRYTLHQSAEAVAVFPETAGLEEPDLRSRLQALYDKLSTAQTKQDWPTVEQLLGSVPQVPQVDRTPEIQALLLKIQGFQVNLLVVRHFLKERPAAEVLDDLSRGLPLIPPLLEPQAPVSAPFQDQLREILIRVVQSLGEARRLSEQEAEEYLLIPNARLPQGSAWLTLMGLAIKDAQDLVRVIPPGKEHVFSLWDHPAVEPLLIKAFASFASAVPITDAAQWIDMNQEQAMLLNLAKILIGTFREGVGEMRPLPSPDELRSALSIARVLGSVSGGLAPFQNSAGELRQAATGARMLSAMAEWVGLPVTAKNLDALVQKFTAGLEETETMALMRSSESEVRSSEVLVAETESAGREALVPSGRGVPGAVAGYPGRSAGPLQLGIGQTPHKPAIFPSQHPPSRFQPPDGQDRPQVEEKPDYKDLRPKWASHERPDYQGGEDDRSEIRRQPNQVLPSLGGQSRGVTHPVQKSTTGITSPQGLPSVEPSAGLEEGVEGIRNQKLGGSNGRVSGRALSASADAAQSPAIRQQPHLSLSRLMPPAGTYPWHSPPSVIAGRTHQHSTDDQTDQSQRHTDSGQLRQVDEEPTGQHRREGDLSQIHQRLSKEITTPVRQTGNTHPYPSVPDRSDGINVALSGLEEGGSRREFLKSLAGAAAQFSGLGEAAGALAQGFGQLAATSSNSSILATGPSSWRAHRTELLDFVGRMTGARAVLATLSSHRGLAEFDASMMATFEGEEPSYRVAVEENFHRGIEKRIEESHRLARSVYDRTRPLHRLINAPPERRKVFFNRLRTKWPPQWKELFQGILAMEDEQLAQGIAWANQHWIEKFQGELFSTAGYLKKLAQSVSEGSGLGDVKAAKSTKGAKAKGEKTASSTVHARREEAQRIVQEGVESLIPSGSWHLFSPEMIRRYPGLRVLAQEAAGLFLLDDEAHTQAIVHLMEETSPIDGIHYYGREEEIAAFHARLFGEPKPLKGLAEGQLIPHLLEGVSLQGFLQQIFANIPRVAEAPPIDWDHFAKALSVLAAT